MSKLYIANTTMQNHTFLYRIPGDNAPKTLEIPVGQQKMIPKDLSFNEVSAIVAQHSRYGLVAADEIDRSRDFIGHCYSVDKAVDINKIRRAIDHNREVLEERGKVLRQEAALAVNMNIEEAQPGELKKLEMTIKEETKNGIDGSIHEGVIVDRNAPPPDAKVGKAGRPRKTS